MNRSINFLITAIVSLTCTIAFSADKTTLEEVVVSARKTTETLQEVPLSISTLSSKDFENLNIRSIDDFAKFTPGLSFSNAFGRATERPVIRGLSNVLAGVQFGVESGVSYFLNGVYYPGDIQSIDLSSIKRIEVVKGPQSALYGRNTYSGAINYVTNEPDFEKFSGNVKVYLANHNEKSTNLSLNIPVSNNTSIGITGRNFSYGGEWKNQITQKTIGQQSTTGASIVINHNSSDISVNYRYLNTVDSDGTRPFAFIAPASGNCPAKVAGNVRAYCGELPSTLIFALNDEYDVDGVANPYYGKKSSQSHSTADLIPDAVNLEKGIAFSGVDRNVELNILNIVYKINKSIDLNISLSQKFEELSTGSDSDHSAYNLQNFARTDLRSGTSASPVTPASTTTCWNISCESIFADSSKKEFDDKVTEIRIQSNESSDIKWIAGLYNYERRIEQFDIAFQTGQEPNVANNKLWRCENLDGTLADSEYNSSTRTYLCPRLSAVSFYTLAHGYKQNKSSLSNDAIYAMIEFEAGDGVSLSFEIRNQKETKHQIEYREDGGLNGNILSTNRNNIYNSNRLIEKSDYSGVVSFNQKKTWENTLPRITLKYQSDEYNNLYLIYSQGVKAGGFNGTLGRFLLNGVEQDRSEYKQETSVNYELGYKGVFDDGKTLFSLSLYKNDIKDIQTSQALSAILPGGSNTTSIVVNQSNGLTQGLEIELKAIVTDSVSINFSYATVDAHFTSGYDPVLAQVNFIQNGCTVVATTNFLTGNPTCGGVEFTGTEAQVKQYGSIKNKKFAFVPEYTASLSINVNEEMDTKSSINYSLSATFEDKKFTQIDNFQYVGAVTLLDSKISFIMDKVTLSIFGKNILNDTTPILATRWFEIGAASSGANPTTGSRGRAYFVAPRRGASYGIEVNYNF
ncbi:MAG: TonB-dependent receptor [Methylacidiphilales bacterium]|nr:TonB-dependent receptor [Candidatus Methylacidiphilales bacterium]